MTLYAKKKYYMWVICKYKNKIERDIYTKLPPYHQLESICTFTDDDVTISKGNVSYYIGYLYLDRLVREDPV